MSTHTPGPWRIRKAFASDEEFEVYPAYTDKPSPKPGKWAEIATVCGHGLRPRASAKANARLIAAAPELLEALEWLVALAPDPEHAPDEVTREHVIKANVVIAKAKGDA